MKKERQEIKHNSLPFWSWNDKLEKEKLLAQIDWMKENGFGGFFMHARAGLKTEYLSEEWFECIKACMEYAQEKGMQAWAYDENGWPSGFVGGKLLEQEENREWYLTFSFGKKDENAWIAYDISTEKIKRLSNKETSENSLNIYKNVSVSTVDISDDKVVEKFLKLTHERYKKELGEDFYKLSGFFTDEPQFYRDEIPFPHKIASLFQEEYGEDIIENIGLLFVEKEGFRSFRYRYWKACQKLLLENFAKKVFDWCDKNKCQLTGHYVEERDLYAQMLFNCGIMPFYEFEHIPGLDWLCRRFMSVVPTRQVGSVAAQLGKKEVLTETFAMTGWDVTAKEMKAIAEFQYLYGANKTCQHLLPYSEKNERKRDHPAHFTPLNPWIEQGMYTFNEYFDWLGGIMQESREPVSIAVLHPIRSAYFYFQNGKDVSTAELDSALLTLCNMLAENQIAFHFIDETLLAKHGYVNGNKIGCGQCEYEYLIIPKCYTMDKTTEKFICSYVENGGKVYLADEKPKYLEGEPFAYEYLKSNVSFETLKNAQPYSIVYNGGKIYAVYRKSSQGDFIVMLNISDDETATGILKVKDAETFAEYDFQKDEAYAFDGEFSLEPCQSKIISIGESGKKKTVLKTVCLGSDEFEVKEIDDNALLLDFAKYSLNGKDYSKKYPLFAIFKHLLEKRYEGDLWLKFPFEVQEIPTEIYIESEYEKSAAIFVNDVETKMKNISSLLKIGENNLTVKLHFYESKNVYLALFGEGVTETLKNCLVYDTYLDNIYLRGNFGAYPKNGFKKGQEKNTLLADSFYIAKRQKVLGEFVQSGEPFFSGRVVLQKKVTLNDTNVGLKVNGRIHFARLRINQKDVGSYFFNDELDISKVAKIGENEVEIELYTSPRNKLGPHHEKTWEDNLMVGANSFTLLEQWHDFKCEEFRNSYSLVKTGLFESAESTLNVMYFGIYKDNQAEYERNNR